MKVLAFLQNQWFPERQVDNVRRMFAAYPERRNDLIARFLFFRCLTGKRLRKAFGEEWCDRIIWENASPEIGSESSSVFKADQQHILASLTQHKPDVVLAFGKQASNGLLSALRLIEGPSRFKVICGPHPAARHATVMDDLHDMRMDLNHTESCAT